MTLQELLDTMRSFANVDENRLPDDEGTLFLNEAKDRIMTASRFRFGEAFVQSAFSQASQTFSPQPAGGRFVGITDIWYVNSISARTDLRYVSWNEYVAKWGTAATDTGGSGEPTEFTIYGETADGDPVMYLGPIPDEDINPVFVSGRIVADDLSGLTDENSLSTRIPMGLIYYALYLSADFLEDPDRGPSWLEKAEAIIKREALSHVAARKVARTAISMVEPG